MAMFKEGRDGSSVKYIDPSDNQGAGSSIRWGCMVQEFNQITKLKFL
ncbi:hypothetical protein C9E89_019875 [Acinetobacter sichuanensis]|uniref:Uncharacterized protein n=1 Tax=Acinetobacter sichuanensis TaxID=2136183 RepID=A0A371YK13_9GAMM|nr:hypothetical protein C9E89_019875 [Acinetobacter sichuanensis]